MAAILDAIAWPLPVLIFIRHYKRNIGSLIDTIKIRIEKGASLTTPVISLGTAPSSLQSPEKDEPITENHMALVHSSWRYPKKDSEFKRPMYRFDAIIRAPDQVLDKIEFVKYHLHPSYPNSVQTITDRKSHFKLKELAWGESNLNAEVKIKGQEQLIKLSRYINLTETGEKIP